MTASFVHLGWLALMIVVIGLFCYALAAYWMPVRNCVIFVFCCKRPDPDEMDRGHGQSADAESGRYPNIGNPPPYEPPPSYESIMKSEPIKK